jgi:acyl-CoA thioesterase
MEWIEIIKVQGAATGYNGADTELLKQIAQGMKSKGLKDVRVYAHASVSNDLMITLTWSQDCSQSLGSELAHNLARELKQYGLVDHSVWLERLPDIEP